jgi:hypothetical protein
LADLSRGRRSNDWHVVHFTDRHDHARVGRALSWFFGDATLRDGTAFEPPRIAIITYMQWLGSWLDTYPTYRPRDDPATGAAGEHDSPAASVDGRWYSQC